MFQQSFWIALLIHIAVATKRVETLSTSIPHYIFPPSYAHRTFTSVSYTCFLVGSFHFLERPPFSSSDLPTPSSPFAWRPVPIVFVSTFHWKLIAVQTCPEIIALCCDLQDHLHTPLHWPEARFILYHVLVYKTNSQSLNRKLAQKRQVFVIAAQLHSQKFIQTRRIHPASRRLHEIFLYDTGHTMHPSTCTVSKSMSTTSLNIAISFRALPIYASPFLKRISIVLCKPKRE